MKPDFVGSKSLYLNPSADTFTTADLAAIDGSNGWGTILPYAYTATVREDYDAFNFGTTGTPDIAASSRVAFGLFLSPSNDKHNLIFQVSGRALFAMQDSGYCFGNFFFGRKATNNTVVSDKASANNSLAKFMYLPSNQVSSVNNSNIHDSIETEIFSLELAGGFVYCFGYQLTNYSGTAMTIDGGVSLSIRKYSSTIPAFRPSGV